MTWAVALLPLLALQPNLDVRKDVVYRTVGATKLAMDVYAPKGGPARKPAVVVIHGGAWSAGARQDMDALCRQMAENGLVAATITYRLAPTHRWPAMLDDAQSAVRYLRGNARKYGIDPKRIGASGGSAGGHLALLLGLRDTREAGGFYPKQSSRVKAVFNIFGPVDLSSGFDANVAELVSQQVLGKPYASAGKEIRDFSPITYIGPKAPPIFTLHGLADRLVPPDQARKLDEAMRKAKRPHTLRLVEGMAHGIDATQQAQRQGILDGILFLKRNL